MEFGHRPDEQESMTLLEMYPNGVMECRMFKKEGLPVQNMQNETDLLTETQETETATPAATAAAPAAGVPDKGTKITEFKGVYMTPVKRRISRPDPSNPGKMLTANIVLEGPVGLVVQAVVGKGEFPNTKEKYITVLGQYAPGKTCRITFSSQNAKTVAQLLNGNADTSSGKGPGGSIHWPLKKELVVDVFGTKMRGFALLGEELYLHNDDGTVTPVIGAQQAIGKGEQQGVEDMVL